MSASLPLSSLSEVNSEIPIKKIKAKRNSNIINNASIAEIVGNLKELEDKTVGDGGIKESIKKYRKKK